MVEILSVDNQCSEALGFNHHHSDRDEIFKSQWSHSDQRSADVKMFLSNVKDEEFVLAECIDKVGPTDGAVKCLLMHGLHITDKYKFSKPEGNGPSMQVLNVYMTRLRLLQYKDRLDTFMGINMGRFSRSEYKKFRDAYLSDIAVDLAERGKIGALNLLFKRHPLTLSPFILDILSAIPETVSVESYNQLLPGTCPPSNIHLRDPDWVECEEVMHLISRACKDQSMSELRTELIIMQSTGFVWPTTAELYKWYRRRAHSIDNLSGLLENCISFLEVALQKGVTELHLIKEDACLLYELIYSHTSDEDRTLTMSLVYWEELPDYEKFKMILSDVEKDTVVERLHERALPFVQNRGKFSDPKQADSFFSRWLMEIAAENKLEICLMVIQEGFNLCGVFKDEAEGIDIALRCIYSCTCTDQWNTMTSILLHLTLANKPVLTNKNFSTQPGMSLLGVAGFSERTDHVQAQDEITRTMLEKSEENTDSTKMENTGESLKDRVNLAGCHVEAGRILTLYQVPKPVCFFLLASSDIKGVKQILRLILSKFGRRQPGRSDEEWAAMWQDMQTLREKAFPFLDIEYLLLEFCRGLLKAGKFSTARTYLKGIASHVLTVEKAENLVIQVSREYLFSASSLACIEISKAKECLNLFPDSSTVKAEAGIVEALTVKLPSFGVNLLPMQYKQIRNPMEIINMVIRNHSQAYLDVNELIGIAKLLGLSTEEDVASIQESVAREAALIGDLLLAFDLCVILVKKGHSPIWDLCAAIARGPPFDGMDIFSRKKLLGFALSHCDKESVSELLNAWKDLDMQSQCEKLITLSGTDPWSTQCTGKEEFDDDPEIQLKNNIKSPSNMSKDFSEIEGRWDDISRERSKLKFGGLELSWLLKLNKKVEHGKKSDLDPVNIGKLDMNARSQALSCLLFWFARNDIPPSDDLIVSLAKSVMGSPVTEEEDILGLLFLLNLVDALHGTKAIEEQLRSREEYREIISAMNIGVLHSLLNNSNVECLSPCERRDLLIHCLQERSAPYSDEMIRTDMLQSAFWKKWKSKVEEKKQLAELRTLEQIIPGVEINSFLSRDSSYIQNAILSFTDILKTEVKPILKDSLQLASMYGVDRSQVLLRCLGSMLVSEQWKNDDISAEILDYTKEIFSFSKDVVDMISSVVYTPIDGCNKLRLSYIFSILSECWSHLEGAEEDILVECDVPIKLSYYYKILEQQCKSVSCIPTLNFKNIAGLYGLNIDNFNQEVCRNIFESSIEALAKMVDTLLGMYKDSAAVRSLISWQNVYKFYVENHLKNLEACFKENLDWLSHDSIVYLVNAIEENYEHCKIYIQLLPAADLVDIVMRYYRMSLPSVLILPNELYAPDILLLLLDMWVKLSDEFEVLLSYEKFKENKIILHFFIQSKCLRVLKELVINKGISPGQGWATVSCHFKCFMKYGSTVISNFCMAMISSGCNFRAVSQIFYEVRELMPECTEIMDGAGFLSSIYARMVDLAVLEFDCHSCESCWGPHHLFSSLYQAEGDLGELRRVRNAVWFRLVELSDNMQGHSDAGVHALEVMQLISGKNGGRLMHNLCLCIQPWEQWDAPSSTHESVAQTHDTESQNGQCLSSLSGQLTSTLVAVRSTELARVISPNIDITENDLISLETAISCFLQLSSCACAPLHFSTLAEIIEEWGRVFSTEGMVNLEAHDNLEAPQKENEWEEANWDEGWESIQDQLIDKKELNECSAVHPLHACWMELFKTVIMHNNLSVAIKIIDASSSKTKGILLNQDEAWNLSRTLANADCFSGLKIMLLFPYKVIWFHLLDAVESKLKHEQTLESVKADQELLVLMLSSKTVSTICNNSAYKHICSCICYSVGALSRQYQEHQLFQKRMRKMGNKTRVFHIFERVIFPYFISELVVTHKFLLAAFIISQFMHTHPSLALINIAETSIRRYLEGQIHYVQHSNDTCLEAEMCGSLANTVSSLLGRLQDVLHYALLALPLSMH